MQGNRASVKRHDLPRHEVRVTERPSVRGVVKQALPRQISITFFMKAMSAGVG
jgi:hypothetical protein